MKRAGETSLPFLAPALVLLLLVTIYPLVYVLKLTLERRLLIFGINDFVGLKNYVFLVQDERFWQALSNTLYFALVSVGLELVLGLALALAIQRDFRGKGMVRTIILLPWTIPTVVSAEMWQWIFNSELGLLNNVLHLHVNWLGNPLYALHVAILIDVWKTTPFMVLILTAALQDIPLDIYRSAYVDGASPWTVFRRLTLPLLVPAIAVALTFRILDAVRVFDSIFVLTGGGPAGSTETISLYAYRIMFQTLEFGYGSTVAFSLFLLSLITAAVALPLLRRR